MKMKKTVRAGSIFMAGNGIMPAFTYQRVSDSSDNKDAKFGDIIRENNNDS